MSSLQLRNQARQGERWPPQQALVLRQSHLLLKEFKEDHRIWAKPYARLSGDLGIGPGFKVFIILGFTVAAG